MRLMIISCRMAVKRIGMCGVRVRKRKALAMKMKTLTLVGTGR
jgi:hypothetical protein